MSIQTLLISVLVTCVTVGATFFYFRNRMQRTEQKIDLMFNLIQEHQNTAKLRQQFQPVNAMQHPDVVAMEQQMNDGNNENELINISDDDELDDEEYESDDSAEVSDTEDDKLVIDKDGSDAGDVDSGVKTISLTLEGAETFTPSEVKLDDISNLEEHTIDENDNTEHHQLDAEENDDDEGEEAEDDEDEDEDLDSITLSEDEAGDKEENVTVKKVDVEETTDYNKLNKRRLVEIANEKGMNTKGLKKSALVQLLSGSQ
jgi:hypothetical protein